MRLRTEPIETVAASLGVTTMTLRNWQAALDPQPTAAAPSPTSASLQVQAVKIPETGAPPEVEQEGGGYDAARAAAGLGPPPPGTEPPPTPEPPPKADDTPKIPPEKTLVFMSEMALRISVRFYAARCKVPLEEVQGLDRLTDGERADLETYAPYAAPFMSQMLLKYGIYIGAGIYGFIFWTMLTDRYAEIKRKAPKKEPAPPAKP